MSVINKNKNITADHILKSECYVGDNLQPSQYVKYRNVNSKTTYALVISSETKSNNYLLRYLSDLAL